MSDSKQGANPIFCYSCGSEISSEALAGGAVKQIDGKLHCAACVAEQAQGLSIFCRKCRVKLPPLYDGRSYLCRKCGTVLREHREKKSGASKSAKPVCSVCREALEPGANKCSTCGARFSGGIRVVKTATEWKNYAIGALAMALLCAVGLMIYANRGTQTHAPAQATPAPQPDYAALEAAHQASLRTIREEMLETVGQMIAEMKVELLDKHDDHAPQTQEPEEQQPETSATELDITGILSAIRNIEDRGEVIKTADPVEMIERTEDQPRVEIKPQQEEQATLPATLVADLREAADPELMVEDINNTFAELEAQANALAEALEFITALAILDSRPDITDINFQSKRERAKRAIRTKAEGVFEDDSARADALLREGNIQEAEKVYRLIIQYGFPSMVREAQQHLADIAAEKAATTPVGGTGITQEPHAADSDDPRIAAYIAHLRDRNAAQHLRTQAAKELGVLRATAAVPELIRALDDRDWFLRICAANSLADMGEKRAVPALIRNLEHVMLPVATVAKTSLERITGQDFGNNREAWEAWWKEEIGEDAAQGDEQVETSEEAEDVRHQVAPEPDSFVSQIIIIRPRENNLVFEVRPDVTLKIGQKLNLIREGRKIAEVTVSVVGFGNATARIDTRYDFDLEEGQLIVVEKVDR